MVRPSWRNIALPVLFLLLSTLACTEDGVPVNRDVNIAFAELLPWNWQLVLTREFAFESDANGDDHPDREWVVLYRFDLPEQGEECRSPIHGVVYRMNSNRPADLINHSLGLPENDYLCEWDCGASKEDLIAPISGPELVIRDKHGGHTIRLSIFRFKGYLENYEYVRYFVGDEITTALNHITVDDHLPFGHPYARSQLVRRRVYSVEWGQEPNSWDWQENDLGIIYDCTVPAQALRTPYPEKLVLALYLHYSNAAETRDFFTDAAWDRLEGCWAGQCGCAAPRPTISQVRVIAIQPEGPEDLDADDGCAVISVRVICKQVCCTEGPETEVWWRVVRVDREWRLDDAIVLAEGEEMPSPEQMERILCLETGGSVSVTGGSMSADASQDQILGELEVGMTAP